MKQTPEGAVKTLVHKLLLSYGVFPAKDAPRFTLACKGWYYMPVQNGMGVTGIPDFVGHVKGRFFVVETKSLGKKPTQLQKHQLDAISISGGVAFVIDGEESLKELKKWLDSLFVRL